MAIACTKVKGTAPGGFTPLTLFGGERKHGRLERKGKAMEEIQGAN